MSEKGFDRRDIDGRQAAVIDDAVRKALRETFAILGVDVDDPKQVEEFREDLRFGGKLRKIADHSLLALFGIIVAGIVAAVWAGIVSNIRNH